ncbi:MAG TPA: alpha/beta hydrolase, partial [Acidimicrobiia bacterium]|nr:alpha/beta hydrolase [Acidimicrobiia bacterium]
GQNMISNSHYEPDFQALRRASTRIIVAAGGESDGILPYRAAAVVAQRLGTPLVIFPGDHGGFFGGEYGYTGKPDEFAAKLRQVLSGESGKH